MSLYLIGFFYLTHLLNQVECKDVNGLVNQMDFEGEIFLNTCLHMYPRKVNFELYRQLVLKRQQEQMLQYTNVSAMGEEV